MNHSLRLLVLALVLVASSSCSRQITRVSPDQQIDLSGRWNDTDSQLAAQALTQQVLSQSWIENFQKESFLFEARVWIKRAKRFNNPGVIVLRS